MVFLVAAVVIALMMATVWAISVAIRDASIVDIAWGPGFVAVAWTTFILSYSDFSDGGDTRRAVLLCAMATVWGLRLGVHLGIRNIGKGEDYRYQAMRRRHGDRFWIISLATVYGLQGAVMWIVSLPLQIGISETETGATALWIVGAAVFVIGFGFESIGDWQLARFKADPANASAVMDRGLWRYTRHPNYFGDACAWWGIGLVAASTPIGTVGLVGPALITFLLMRVSGVPMLERAMSKRRKGYDEYVRRTSSFLPLPPKR
ncbi:MAG: DUF1295 domain-containing protein [Acidimicrobiaceae bacterium]|nr:DUF1295 domain-containing protein [Acidimicrobiaceae bacterium]